MFSLHQQRIMEALMSRYGLDPDLVTTCCQVLNLAVSQSSHNTIPPRGALRPQANQRKHDIASIMHLQVRSEEAVQSLSLKNRRHTMT